MRAIRLQNEVTDVVASSEPMKTSEYLLVRELAHRINNEYASLIGVSSRMASRSISDEVKAALFEVINLLHNLPIDQACRPGSARDRDGAVRVRSPSGRREMLEAWYDRLRIDHKFCSARFRRPRRNN